MFLLRKSKAAAGWAAFAFLVLAVLVPWHRHQRDIKTPMSVAFDNLRLGSMQLFRPEGLFAQKFARDHKINHPATGGLHFGPMRDVELHDQCGPCRVVVEPRAVSVEEGLVFGVLDRLPGIAGDDPALGATRCFVG